MGRKFDYAQLLITDRTQLETAAKYWLALAEKHTYRGELYRALCDYKMAAGDFFEFGDKQQL